MSAALVITHGDTDKAYALDEIQTGWCVALLKEGEELPTGPGFTYGVDVVFLSASDTMISYRLLDDDGSMVTYIRPKTEPLADFARLHVY